MTLNTITLKLVSKDPIPPGTSLADIAYLACGHVWPKLSLEIRSRQATRDESQAAETIHVPPPPEATGEERTP